jgi:hypothetical protein
MEISNVKIVHIDTVNDAIYAEKYFNPVLIIVIEKEYTSVVISLNTMLIYKTLDDALVKILQNENYHKIVSRPLHALSLYFPGVVPVNCTTAGYFLQIQSPSNTVRCSLMNFELIKVGMQRQSMDAQNYLKLITVTLMKYLYPYYKNIIMNTPCLGANLDSMACSVTNTVV